MTFRSDPRFAVGEVVRVVFRDGVTAFSRTSVLLCEWVEPGSGWINSITKQAAHGWAYRVDAAPSMLLLEGALRPIPPGYDEPERVAWADLLDTLRRTEAPPETETAYRLQ